MPIKILVWNQFDKNPLHFLDPNKYEVASINPNESQGVDPLHFDVQILFSNKEHREIKQLSGLPPLLEIDVRDTGNKYDYLVDEKYVSTAQIEKLICQKFAINELCLKQLKLSLDTLIHEVTSPLTMINLSIERLLRNLLHLTSDLSNEKDTKDVLFSQISLCKKSLGKTDFINNILRSHWLTVFKPSSKDFRHEYINKIICETIDMVSDNFFDQKVKVCFSEAHSSSLKIQCIPTQISQLLCNLIKNSIEAKVSDSLLTISIEVNHTNNFIDLIYSDDGQGIPDEIANSIFNKNFSSKSRSTNSGLGLYLCQKIAKIHGGEIALVQNKPVRFKISLPSSINGASRF